MKELDANEIFQTTSDKIALLTFNTPADLFYSVNGINWTIWKDQITENNVVISNIPKGLYLYLTKPCIITD